MNISTASAETYTATSEHRDFYFTSQEPAVMTIRTYAQQYNIDSMLWVYRPDNTVVTQNDDYFGLDSYVSFNMDAGVMYRLRAGVCCGDPNRWYGTSYTIEPSQAPLNVPTTSTLPESTTTSLPPTTTTEEPTTTTSSTTTTTSSTTVVPSTTSQPPTTTTSSSTTTEPSTTTTTSSTVVSTTTTSTQPPLPIVASTVPSTTTSSSTSTSTTSTSTTVSSTTTVPPPPTPVQELEPEKVAAAVVEQIEDATDEELETFFEELNLAALTAEQQDAVAEALSNAPDDVKKILESTVNVFGEGFDNYTPIGSNVTIAERKVLIAATGVLFMAPTVSVSSSTSGSQSSDSRRRR